MATVYKFEITSHWIAHHPNDMKKMIEKALYSCENEITVNNLENQANEAKTSEKREGLIALVKGWKHYWMARVGATVENYIDEYLSN